MVHYNELHPSEPQHHGHFSACAATLANILDFVQEVCSTEITEESRSKDNKRFVQLLEQLKNDLARVKSDFPVEKRHLWVGSEIERYEQAVKKTESLSAKFTELLDLEV